MTDEEHLEKYQKAYGILSEEQKTEVIDIESSWNEFMCQW